MEAISRLNNQQAIGTSFKFNVSALFRELTRLFGEPDYGPFDGKVRAQWVIGTPHGVATIYDWKEATALVRLTNWHIGAKYLEAAKYIKEIIERD